MKVEGIGYTLTNQRRNNIDIFGVGPFGVIRRRLDNVHRDGYMID